VLRACADPRRPNGWINQAIERAYRRLHELGVAHSVEAWDAHTGELAGGLYGVAIGGLFAGESMFHRGVDASKVALVALVHAMRDGGGKLLDVQWATEHLVRLGAVEIPRERYVELVAAAADAPPMTCWDRPTVARPDAETAPTEESAP
jgi:leucyl/phenylalanyl-tRNA--protein transferase